VCGVTPILSHICFSIGLKWILARINYIGD
jgi:hypothetical protein